jgi:hypothetical protein
LKTLWVRFGILFITTMPLFGMKRHYDISLTFLDYQNSFFIPTNNPGSG